MFLPVPPTNHICIKINTFYYTGHIKPLVVAQKRKIKTLISKIKLHDSEMLFKETNLLSIDKLNIYNVCIFVYKNLHGQLNYITFKTPIISQNYNIKRFIIWVIPAQIIRSGNHEN